MFASFHTFNGLSEEYVSARGKAAFDPAAPTIAEMTEVALRVLAAGERRFLLVVEEEGTDNFGNRNNASAMMEAMRRADEAIGVARRYVHDQPATLLITAADSDAGGMRMVGVPAGQDPAADLPPRDANGAPTDGLTGTGSAPFMSAPDREGRRHAFRIVWAARDDVSGGVLVRAEGLNSERVHGSMDNTEIAELIRLTLLGRSAAE